MYLKKKPIPNERERDFIVGHCIDFSNFFCLVIFMNHKHEALWLMRICTLYIDFI
jgi:hypothetical protein